MALAPLRTRPVACPLCGARGGEVLARARDHEYPHTSSEDFAYVRCACGVVYLDPRPVEEELGRIYPEDYYAYRVIASRARGASAEVSRLGRFMDRRAVSRLRAYAEEVRASRPDPGGPRRVLDVGCGDGAVLDQLARAFEGEPVETHGVEMDARAAEIARSRGHTITSARIEEAALAPRTFDLACSFHVIEHVEDPLAFLTAMGNAVADGGRLLLDTPNVDTWDFRWFGASGAWGAYHAPRHFHLWSPATFTELASRAGLEVLSVSFLPSAVFWVWTLHAALHPRAPRLADRLFPPVDIHLGGGPWIWGLMSGFTALDLGLRAASGRTSNMRVWLRPRGR